MLLALLACAAQPVVTKTPAIAADIDTVLVAEGSLYQRIAGDDGAQLVLFYGGEEKGSLEPCGCPVRPRGGAARLAAYRQASRDGSPGTTDLLLNGGHWLDDALTLEGTVRPDASVVNQWMVRGLQQLEPSALNVGYHDLPGLDSVAEPTDLPIVSANVTGPDIVPYRIVSAADRRIGITGITAPGIPFLDTFGHQVSDPLKAGDAVLEELAPQVDLLILLSYQAPEAARRLAEAHPIDVVVDTNLHREFYGLDRVGSALWVRSHLQTMRLGELRLGLSEQGIDWAMDRKVDLDDEVPSMKDALALAKKARKEIDRAHKAVFP